MDFRQMRAVGITQALSDKTEVGGDTWRTHHNYRCLLLLPFSLFNFDSEYNLITQTQKL